MKKILKRLPSCDRTTAMTRIMQANDSMLILKLAITALAGQTVDIHTDYSRCCLFQIFLDTLLLFGSA